MRGGVWTRACVLALLSICSAGCGGGGAGGGVQQLPPPQPDFALMVSAGSVSVAQGASSTPVNVGVTGSNGFSGTVQVSLGGLPAGVTSNPASPFSVSAGQQVSVIFGAASNAATGQFTVSAQGTSGSLSHSASLSLTIQAFVSTFAIPRTIYAPNDSVTGADVPAGETRRKEVVYDPTGKRLFVANRAMNRVEVYSDPGLALQGMIDAPAASSVDLSTDGSTLWVGTATEEILAVDVSTLQVKSRYPIGGLMPIPGVVFLRPTEVLALSTGNFALRLRQAGVAESLLALWNPETNALTNLTSQAPAAFQNGVGVVARTGDRAHFVAGANDASGLAAVFDGNGNVTAGPKKVGGGTITALAANQDGSKIAAILLSGGTTTVFLLDRSLNLQADYPANAAAGIAFSRDGQTLYVAETLGNGQVVTALTAGTLQKTGQVADAAASGVSTAIEEADDAEMVIGRGNRGVAAIDVSQPGILATPAPQFGSVPIVQPAEGPNAGNTAVTITGTGFAQGAEVAFGGQNPIPVSMSGATQLQVGTPPSATSGPVNVTAYFPNGWLAIAPSGFSYGPNIQAILPNAGKSAGGDTVTILGYGFGTAAGNIAVSIGGQTAAVQKVEMLPSFSNALGLDGSYPFSLERITLTTPAGTSGKADVTITAPSGTTTFAKRFQFVQSSQTYAHPGLYKFVQYDQSRQRVYLSATDHVDVFDLQAQVYKNPINPPPNGPPPDAGLRGLAMTPDASQLVVADFGAQKVYLIDPDGPENNGAVVPVGGVAGFLNSGPSRVAATNDSTVFVGLSGEGGSAGACAGCLGQMNLSASPPSYEPAPQPEVASITGTPFVQSDAAGDLVYLAYGNTATGPVASWTSTAPNAFATSMAQDVAADLTSSGDGTMFAMRGSGAAEIRDANLTMMAAPAQRETENVPGRVNVPGVAMHPSGALLYEPFLDGPAPAAPPATGIRGGIDIRDAHNGQLRMRLYLPEPFAMLSTDVDGLHGGFLTVDENGQSLFAVTTSGLTVVQLAAVPLGIGTLSPAQASAAGGTSVTLRGSGFQTGATLTIGGKAVNVTVKDMNTLTFTTPAMNAGAQRVVVTNPDGEKAALDAAFFAM